MTRRFAAVRIADGYVENVASFSDEGTIFDPPHGCTWVEDLADPATDGSAEPGGTWTGTEFLPSDPPPPPEPTIEDRVASLEADWAEGGAMRDAIAADVAALQAAMPTKATNAPPAVASSGACGAVETRFALEDHEHAINASQQSQISALQGNVSSLLSLTGGLNTPAPATAAGTTPSSAAVGTSAKYAREDHVHPAQSVPSASSATPAALAVTGAAGSGTAFSRDDHVHPLPTVASATPARTLNSAGFQPSTTKAVWVTYSVRITCSASLSGNQDGKVELMCDANATPTTVRATVQNRNSVAIAIALTIVNEQTAQLSYLVPAGHYVRLISTQTTGSPTITLINQAEVTIG